jgi:hypothetical protein
MGYEDDCSLKSSLLDPSPNPYNIFIEVNFNIILLYRIRYLQRSLLWMLANIMLRSFLSPPPPLYKILTIIYIFSIQA